jgi:hypothetical protein
MSRIAGTAEFYRLIYLDSGRLTSLDDDFGIINEFIDSVSTIGVRLRSETDRLRCLDEVIFRNRVERGYDT